MAVPSEMGRPVAVVLYVVAMAAVIVGVDFAFFRSRFWERLIVNIGIVLLFAAFYWRFLKASMSAVNYLVRSNVRWAMRDRDVSWRGLLSRFQRETGLSRVGIVGNRIGRWWGAIAGSGRGQMVTRLLPDPKSQRFCSETLIRSVGSGPTGRCFKCHSPRPPFMIGDKQVSSATRSATLLGRILADSGGHRR